MKTLYVSDLDGTLLNSSDRLSEFTVRTLNDFIRKGICFSYATARSLSSASIVASGLTTEFPVIIYNGAFVLNAKTGEILSSLKFSPAERNEVSEFLSELNIFPLVYAYVGGLERVSWLDGSENEGMLFYLRNRKGDKRLRKVNTPGELYAGESFYYTCIGTQSELLPVYERFSRDERYTCIIQQELYREEYWCEIMPRKATKANAILQLKEIAGCDRIISFGDAVNDIPMFQISDECYAVSNAVSELKEIATSVIESNNEDGVARWMAKNIRI